MIYQLIGYNLYMNQPKQEIKIQDNIPGAEYSNLMQVRHNKDEIMLMFANVMPPTGKTVAKVVTNPSHFKKIVNALQDNLKKYEEKYGIIEQSPENSNGINNWEVFPPKKD